MDSVKYYEVEGAVFRKPSGKPMEVYFGGDSGWTKYTGDDSRVYRLSNVMTLDEVKEDMDYIDERARARAVTA